MTATQKEIEAFLEDRMGVPEWWELNTHGVAYLDTYYGTLRIARDRHNKLSVELVDPDTGDLADWKGESE